MLTSYNRKRGKLTVSMVKRSGVGVTIAAMIRISTAAYLLEERMNAGVMTPNFDRIKIMIGNSKMIPDPMVNVATVEKYESIVIWLLMISLTV